MMRIFKLLQANKQEKYNRRIAKLYHTVFDSEEGQEVLADLIMHGCVLESHDGDNIKEGIRKCVLRILGILDYDPQKFLSLKKKMTSSDEIEED